MFFKDDSNEVQLAKIQLEFQKLELQKLELKMKLEAEKFHLEAQQRGQFYIFLLFVGATILSVMFPEIEAILGRPLTCLLPLMAGYFYGKREK